ncbi:MAG: sporulation inhibitor of replication protein SirA [Firmicutes bacterium]|nr:sporulation inhibitor of replication protein SirA [Bacillota bacterium]
MRKFYIFNINKEFEILNKNDGYELYRQMEIINNLSRDEFYIAVKIYETLVSPIDKSKFNDEVYNNHKNSFFYTKYKNNHMINNYYKDEESRLVINKCYLILETNILKPSFIKDLINKGLFVCDFENKDYFWLDSLYSS